MRVPQPGPGPPLVGRDEELALVAAAVGHAAVGRATTLLVSGPAGVGKTALVEAAIAPAAHDGMVVLQGAGLPLTLLASPFRTIRSLLSDTPVDVDPPPVGGVASAVSVDPVELDTWLGALAEDRGVVLVVDDLHWVDPESLDVLRYVVAGGRTRRVGVVLTVRSEELVDGHPLHRWLADVRRLPGFEELVVAPLDRFATEQQMTSILGAVPHAALVDEVFDRSQGLPYLTRLLVAGLEPSAAHLSDDAPPALEDAVLASWHGLSAGARQLTTVLAIAGHGMTRSELREVVNGHLDAEKVSRWTAEAVGRAVLEVDGHGCVWFQHPLQAELLEQRADPDDRRAWHRICAEELRRRLAEEPDPVGDPARVAAVAAHFDAAGLPVDAFDWYVRVARGLGGPFSDQHVVLALRRALVLHPLVGVDRPGVVELLWQLRQVTARLGDLRGELDAVEALTRLAAPDGSIEAHVELRMRRSGLRHLCRLAQMSPVEEERTAGLAAGCPGTWQEAMALARFAFSVFMRPSAVDFATIGRARRAGEDALRKARRIGDDAALAFALATASASAELDDDLDAAARLAVEGLHCAARAGDFALFELCAMVESNALGLHHGTDARDLHLRRRQEAISLGAPHPWVAAFSVEAARAALTIGDVATADQMVRFCLGAPPGPLADVGARLVATRLALLQGRLDEATQHWARADELLSSRFDNLGDQSTQAELLAARGDHTGAFAVCRQALERGADRVTYGEWLLPLAARALADLAEEARARADTASSVDGALRWLTAEYPPTDGADGRAPSLPLDGNLDHAGYRRQRAGLGAWYAAELGRARHQEGAAHRWQRAATALDVAGLPFEASYAWMRCGEAHLLAARPARPAAAAALREAAARAEPLKAAPVLQKVESLARTARVSLDEVSRPDAAVLPGLTPRESEILGHVVAGRTYAEIAETLVISEKTVSSHISNMLRKTRSMNRHELAARAQAAQRRTG